MKSKGSKKKTPTRKEKKQRILRIVLAVLVLIIALRILLPYVVLDFVNKELAELRGYFGHVEDIDISLYRGAYIVKDIYINKKDTATGKQTPLFACPNIDISIEWASLFKGRIVSEF